MTAEIIFVVEESVDGGFEAKALDHSIFRLHMVKDEVIADKPEAMSG